MSLRSLFSGGVHGPGLMYSLKPGPGMLQLGRNGTFWPIKSPLVGFCGWGHVSVILSGRAVLFCSGLACGSPSAGESGFLVFIVLPDGLFRLSSRCGFPPPHLAAAMAALAFPRQSSAPSPRPQIRQSCGGGGSAAAAVFKYAGTRMKEKLLGEMTEKKVMEAEAICAGDGRPMSARRRGTRTKR